MKTFTRALTFAAAVLLLVAAAAEAKGRGGGGNGGGNGGRGGHGTTLHGGSGGPRGGGLSIRDRQRQHLQVNDSQRGQYHDCAAAGDRMRQQSRAMAKASRGPDFNAAEARRQRDRLSQGAGNLFREHDRLMSGLGEHARSALQDRTRTLDRNRDRIHAHLQAMDRELGRGNPDPNALRAQARKLNQAMKTWQKHYRQLGSDLGATAG